MIIVDRALEERHERGDPVRVAMVGAGFMGRGIARQVVGSVRGMELVAIANRDPDHAAEAYRAAGVEDVVPVSSSRALERSMASRRCAITDDPDVLCEAEGVDAIVEVTGAVQHAARVALATIANGKHLVLMNAELDGTVGPILKAKADAAGVVYTNTDGDQPGVIMNLFRFVTGIGVRPVLCGNVKGLHDPHRNPTTQEAFARRWGQKPVMVSSFADGTKISFEQAIVANATGMRVLRRGMLGPAVEEGTRIEDAASRFPVDELTEGDGVVDYVVGAHPAPGVFVLGTHEDPVQRHYLALYKLGDGPLYCFSTPYHLCHFEVPNTVARAVLFRDAAIAPQGPQRVDVVAAAKVDLHAGDVIDGLGGYRTYGLAENADTVAAEQLLPMGLAEGCRLVRDVPRDSVLAYDDVTVPAGRPADLLREEQSRRLGVEPSIRFGEAAAGRELGRTADRR